MKRLHRRVVLGLLAAITMATIGCNLSANDPNDVEVRLGILATLSGDSISVGEATVMGAELALADLEARGGVQLKGQRQPLSLVIEDDQDQVDRC
jgi:ABC-type branched-subunit amino acid transport system substrate-binding protein